MGEKNRKLFIFGVILENQYSLARIGNRNVKNHEEPHARIVRHCVWHSTCYNARHIVTRNNPAYSIRIYQGAFIVTPLLPRGLTPVCLELRLRSQRGFIADLSRGFAKRWHSLLPPSWCYDIRQERRPSSSLCRTRALVTLLAA